MTTENENQGANPQKSQTEIGGLNVENLASLLDSSGLTNSPQTDAAESVNQTAEAQEYRVEDPLAEGAIAGLGIDNESSQNTAVGREDDSEQEDGIPKHIQKRIDKITAKRREAEAEADRLRKQLEDLQNKKDEVIPASSRAKNPFRSITDDAALNKAVEQARQVRDWCEENPYGGDIPRSDGSSVHVDETEVRRMKIQALKDLEKNIPEQVSFLNARKHFDPIAEQEYPWWKKKDTKEYSTAIALLKNFPELTEFPDYKLVIGDFVLGMQARQAKKAVRPESITKRAPYQPSRPSASPSTHSNTKNVSEVESRFLKTGSKDDLASLIELKLGR
jgi:hypothetical protein